MALSYDLQAKISSLQLNLQSITDEVDRVNAQINDLLHKQGDLNSEKLSLQKELDRLMRKEKESSEHWSSTNFSWDDNVKKVLREKFNINKLRPLQKETINVTLSSRDCILIMPTGGGKSLCFQLPAVVDHKGFTLVVSPLISLMEDQYFALNQLNINATILKASSTRLDITNTLKNMISQDSTMKILYVTPEKLAKSKRFMTKLQKAHQLNLLNRIVIDEVHCTSHWGHDFRPDYTILGILKRQYPTVPILGLTATASEKILNDVIDILNLDHRCVIFRASFNRPNLFYEVYHTSLSSQALIIDIKYRINSQFNGMSGIVYCFSRKDSEEVASELSKYGISAHCYHSELAADVKSKVHLGWSKGEIQVVVATIAFGMGIDKPNVRFVIHYSISKSIENYYQESGRAGRDGEKSWCIIYFRFQDIFRQSAMVFTEKIGLSNLHNMLRFCLDQSTCRRTLIGQYFNEEWPSVKCQKMCDNCDNEISDSDCVARDLKSDSESIMEIITKATNLEERVTPLKILTAWMGSGKVSYRPKNVSTLSQEECEKIIGKLLVEQIVKEDFHFTPYSTITYLLPGPRWPLLKSSQISLHVNVAATTGTSESTTMSTKKNSLKNSSSKVSSVSKSNRKIKRRPDKEDKLHMKKKKVVILDSDSSEDN